MFIMTEKQPHIIKQMRDYKNESLVFTLKLSTGLAAFGLLCKSWGFTIKGFVNQRRDLHPVIDRGQCSVGSA